MEACSRWVHRGGGAGEVRSPRKRARAGREFVPAADAAPGADERRRGGEVDIRILPVEFHQAYERWRTLDSAVKEYSEEDFEDLLLFGPRTLPRDACQLRRQNLNFLTQHDEWVRRSGVKQTGRSVHEHLAITRAMHYVTRYAQLQIVILASGEARNRRRTLIEAAYAGHPESPS